MDKKSADHNQEKIFKHDIPKMPEGYYGGDKPNPNLRAFVEAHVKETPYNPETDKYEVPGFDKTIDTTKTSAIYSMHAYHLGKKPHDAIESYIKHYTSEDELILDPFCGSGSTAVAALINNRAAIAIDLSPAATFITRFYVTRADPHDFAARFEALCKAVEKDMQFLYGTRCHRCKGEATIHYVIYSNVYQCPRCLRNTSLFETTQHTPACCPSCLAERKISEPIETSLKLVGYEPVAVNFSCHGSCKPKRALRAVTGPTEEDRKAFLTIDLPRISEIEKMNIPYRYPSDFMMNVEDASKPWGDEWRPSRNFRKVSDLFTHRNLGALAAVFNAAGLDNDLRALITSGMLAVSRKAQHLDAGGGYIPGNWALPPMSKQRNVIESLTKVFSKTIKAKKELSRLVRSTKVCVSTQSAVSLTNITSNSVDYIFTDPPYAGAVQYAELNFIWEAWLGLDTHWHDKEIIVNAV